MKFVKLISNKLYPIIDTYELQIEIDVIKSIESNSILTCSAHSNKLYVLIKIADNTYIYSQQFKHTGMFEQLSYVTNVEIIPCNFSQKVQYRFYKGTEYVDHWYGVLIELTEVELATILLYSL